MRSFKNHLVLLELFKDRLDKNGIERSILAKSLQDANTSSSEANLGFMMPNDRHTVFKGLGHIDDALTIAKDLLRQHSLGDKTQFIADKQIYDHIVHKTEVGQIFYDFAEYEDAVFKARGASLHKRKAQSLKNMIDQWNWGGGNQYAYDSAEEQWNAEYGSKFPDSYDLKLYRGGSIDKPVQSWTTDSEGAWAGSHRFTVDHQSSIKKLRQHGFRPIAGISHMVGASGECEVLMVKFPI